MRQLLITAGLLLPLSLDTFAVAAALGVAGIGARDRTRVTIVFTLFEAGMPVAWFLASRAAASTFGDRADYLAIAILFVVGILMLRTETGADEGGQIRMLALARGPAIVLLGLSVSADEAGIGASAGLLGLPIAVVVIWVAVQAFAAAQIGMRFGARVGEELRERSEQAAGLALIAGALVLLGLKLLKL